MPKTSRNPMDQLHSILKTSRIASTDRKLAELLDSADPLSHIRAQFHIPQDARGKEKVYLSGNSLGLQPKSVQSDILQELAIWKNSGVDRPHSSTGSRSGGHSQVLSTMARMVGAANSTEVAITEALTTNLHFLFAPFYRPTQPRFKILMEAQSFSTDYFVVESHVKRWGYDPGSAIIQVRPRDGELTIRNEDILQILEAQGHEIALVFFSGVHYNTGQVFDMKDITAVGHRKGCIVGFDLAHAVGNIPLHCHDWGLDFAAWCGYKYLNSGPGAVGGIFVHERHHSADHLCILRGEQNATQKSDDANPPQETVGAARFSLSTPDILSLAALSASMRVFDKAEEGLRRAKTVVMSKYLRMLLKARLGRASIEIVTPEQSEDMTGCQMHIKLEKDVTSQLLSLGLVCSVKANNVLRIATIPLYNTFGDVFEFVQGLTKVLLAE